MRRGMVVPLRVSLADLLRTTIEPTAGDAVAIIVQLAQSPQTGRPIRARLDASHVWLYADGTVTLSPGLLPPLQEVAALLGNLLGRVDTASGMPRGLVTIVETAALNKAGFTIPSLSAFAAALAPFQPPEPAAAVRALVAKLDGVPIVVFSHASELIPEPEPPPPPSPSRARCRPRSRTCCFNPNPGRTRCRPGHLHRRAQPSRARPRSRRGHGGPRRGR